MLLRDQRIVLPRNLARVEDESRWIAGIRDGDEAAFEALFRSYYSRLCRFVLRLVRDPSVAEELIQGVFLNLWENRKSWNPESSVRCYLYRAAKNQALNHLKHEKIVEAWRERELERDPISSPGIEEQLREKELLAAVQQGIELLPPRCRLVFVLHRQHELTYPEIADVLDISVKTVETQIGRALKVLRKIVLPYLTLLCSASLLFSNPL